MSEHRSIQLRSGGRIEIGPDWTRIHLTTNDLEVYGESRDDQAQTARDLGYGNDIPAMTRNHDSLHALLADLLGLDWSYSMHYATGYLPPEETRTARLEENAVMALQKYICELGLDVVEIARRNGYAVTEGSELLSKAA